MTILTLAKPACFTASITVAKAPNVDRILIDHLKADDFVVRETAAFGLGDSDKYIAQGDAQGVALASIQGLYQLVQEKDEQIRLLKAALELLETRVARSESVLGLHH